jgi:uncharacterized protein (TIGR03382 family)
MTEYFQLAEPDGREFGPLIALTFEVVGTGTSGSDAGPGELAGACSAGGSTGSPWLLIAALLLRLRRRRAA